MTDLSERFSVLVYAICTKHSREIAEGNGISTSERFGRTHPLVSIVALALLTLTPARTDSYRLELLCKRQYRLANPWRELEGVCMSPPLTLTGLLRCWRSICLRASNEELRMCKRTPPCALPLVSAFNRPIERMVDWVPA